MQKLKPHQYFLYPLLLISLIIIGVSFLKNGEGGFALYAAVPFALCGAVYVMSPQIDWRFYKKNPPELAPPVRRFIEEKFLYYQNLTTENKQKFRSRLSLYTIGNEFMRPAPPNEDVRVRNDVPEDLKAAAGACAIQLTFGLPDFMLNPFEHIIIYPAPFPSPQYPRYFHTSETYVQDGVVLFSADALVEGFINPGYYYSIGLHEYAKAFIFKNSQVILPQLGKNIWQDLENISSMTQSRIAARINLPDVGAPPVAIHHFFTFPQRFKEILPDVYQLFENIFNQNPLQPNAPVVNRNQ